MGNWNSAHFALSISLIPAFEGDLVWFIISFLTDVSYVVVFFIICILVFLYNSCLQYEISASSVLEILLASTGYSSRLMTDKHPSYHPMA